MKGRIRARLIAPLIWLALAVTPGMVVTPAAYANTAGAEATRISDAAGLAGRPASHPAAWHDSDRIFGSAPVARTTDEIRAMRATRRPHPPSDPVLACYLTDHIATRCPQNRHP